MQTTVCEEIMLHDAAKSFGRLAVSDSPQFGMYLSVGSWPGLAGQDLQYPGWYQTRSFSGHVFELMGPTCAPDSTVARIWQAIDERFDVYLEHWKEVAFAHRHNYTNNHYISRADVERLSSTLSATALYLKAVYFGYTESWSVIIGINHDYFSYKGIRLEYTDSNLEAVLFGE